MSNLNVPRYHQMLIPALKALQSLGGSANVDEFNARVIKLMKLSDEVCGVMHLKRDNMTEVEYQLAWARTYLRKYGVLDNPSRGMWRFAKSFNGDVDLLSAKEIVTKVRSMSRIPEKNPHKTDTVVVSKVKNSDESLIYILTNPSFPNYVKIGKTTDLQQRIKSLNNPTCLPFSFRIYATYKVDKNLDEVESSIHNLIDKIDYSLRAREETDSKRLREREFFALDAENAFDVLREIARLRKDEANLIQVKQSKQEKVEEHIAKTVEVQAGKTKSADFSFERKGIKPGTEIVYRKDNTLKAKVVDDKSVVYMGGKYSLSGLAAKLLGKKSSEGVRGPSFFKLNGKSLLDYPDVEG